MYPILFLSVTGLVMLFLGLSKNTQRLLPFQILCLLGALATLIIDYNSPGLYFNSMIEINNGVLLTQLVLIVTALLVSGISAKQFEDQNAHPAEYYAILQFAVVGALVMVSFKNFIMLFVGLEILSVGLYVLTGSDKRNLRGNEAAIKYFLMGAFATGILLFGIAMLYGATGSFDIEMGSSMINKAPEAKVFFWIGMLFTSAGLLFKISAVPFHFWTADVYQGAPSVFTAFMAAIVKTAGIFAIYRIFASTFAFEYNNWATYMLIIIFLGIIVGNVTAVFQSNFKRTMAFSSISQAGFLLLSIIGIGVHSQGNLAFYALSYSMATVSAFGVFIAVRANQLENGRPSEDFKVFEGLYKRNPFLGVVLTISMLSLAGIPLTSGFWSKFFVLNDAANRGYFWVLIVGALMSAVSLYYYFKPIRAAFQTSENTAAYELPVLTKYALAISTLLTLVFGLAPDLFRNLFQ
jgi:NADH-quinone oxidoreductase subunit N